MAVHRRNGLAVRDWESWRHLWLHADSALEGASWTKGWLLEDSQGEVVGSLANIPQEYFWNGRRIVAACASQWAVDEAHRSQSVWLAARFFQQRGADLLLNTTANEAAGRVFAGLKAERPPSSACNQVRYWVTDYRQAVAAKLGKWFPGAGCLGWIVAAAVGGCRSFRSRKAAASDLSIEVAAGFDDRFNILWQAIRNRRDRLLAVRDAAALAWRFGNVLRRGAATILIAHRQASPIGYAVVVRIQDQARGLERWRIADLQARDEANEAIVCRAIVAQAMELARRSGAATLELYGQSTEKLASLAALKPRIWIQPTWPFYYKALSQDLAVALAADTAWDPALIDGDACLF